MKKKTSSSAAHLGHGAVHLPNVSSPGKYSELLVFVIGLLAVVGSSTPAENLLLRPPSISYWGGQVATGACLEADAVCGGHSIYAPCILAFPYFSRFLQCLRQYRDTKDEMFLHNGVCSDKTTLLFWIDPLLLASHKCCSFMCQSDHNL